MSFLIIFRTFVNQKLIRLIMNGGVNFKSDVASYFGDHLTSESLFTTELVGKIVAELKTGRDAGIDG